MHGQRAPLYRVERAPMLRADVLRCGRYCTDGLLPSDVPGRFWCNPCGYVQYTASPAHLPPVLPVRPDPV